MSRDVWVRVLVATALLLIGWSLIVVLTGGVRWQTAFFRISSTNPARPLLLGLLCGAAAWSVDAGRVAAFVQRFERAVIRNAPIIAIAVALIVTWMGVRWGTHAAGGADAYGYVSEADLWLGGHLKIDQRSLDFGPPFDDWVFSPLGYKPSATPQVIVPTYSPGLPLLMAAAKVVAGADAVYWVVPVLGGLTAVLTLALGRLLFDDITGVAACVLLAASPAFLFQVMWPMSDIPVTAAWSLALVFAASRRPLAAGLASALAIALRPNLAPLAAAVAAISCLDVWRAVEPRLAVARILVRFAAGAAPAIVAIAFLNAYLYGSPWQSGYGSLSVIYHVRYLRANLARYPVWLIDTQTPFIVAACAPLISRRFGLPATLSQRPYIRVSVALFLALLVVPYFFYFPYDAWWFLRFLLPGLPVLLVLAVGAVRSTKRLVRAEAHMVLLAALTFVVFKAELTTAQQRSVFDLRAGEQRYIDVARDLEQITPPNGIYLSKQHSGSIRYYTHRLTARYDSLPIDSLDVAVDMLRTRGFHPYFVLENWEEPAFRARFPDNVDGRLDWNPVKRWKGTVPVALYDPPARPPARKPSGPWRK